MEFREIIKHNNHTPAELNFFIATIYQRKWSKEEAKEFVEPYINHIKHNPRFIGVIENWTTAKWYDETGYHNNEIIHKTTIKYIDVGFLGAHWFRYILSEETFKLYNY
jgi:hypothetical protein